MLYATFSPSSSRASKQQHRLILCLAGENRAQPKTGSQERERERETRRREGLPLKKMLLTLGLMCSRGRKKRRERGAIYPLLTPLPCMTLPRNRHGLQLHPLWGEGGGGGKNRIPHIHEESVEEFKALLYTVRIPIAASTRPHSRTTITNNSSSSLSHHTTWSDSSSSNTRTSSTSTPTHPPRPPRPWTAVAAEATEAAEAAAEATAGARRGATRPPPR